MADRSTTVIGSDEVAFSSTGPNAHVAGVPIEPKLTGTNETQLQMVVSNTSPTTQTVLGVYDKMLFICDMGGNKALAIPPQQAVTLETDAPFKLKGSATGVTYIVGQLFARGLYSLRAVGAGRGGAVGGGGGSGGATESREFIGGTYGGHTYQTP